MDLRVYFRKIREIEAALTEEYPVLVSVETPDGGKPGSYCEATRYNAARMIAEGRAVLATAEQAEEYRAQQAAARKAAAQAEIAKRIQVAIVSDSDSIMANPSQRDGQTPNGK